MRGKFKDCFGNAYINSEDGSHLINLEKEPEYQTRDNRLQRISRYVSGAKDCCTLNELQKQKLRKYQEELFEIFKENYDKILADPEIKYSYEHAGKNIEAAICYSGCNPMYPRSNISSQT